ncbi:DUF6265 family protein [Pseudozobellia thermophila]|uniref:DUF6265 domain-containing protein n=1 Tax=Pseudozobellia thermophila TaxID=192903 RepID=A0A1M6CIP2_9FLAO|nr:DUF6265 family protein [Pseudozobellia thermophila]SHI60905.1 hypothetical protein SAMN04488513_101779 [Pseudozobellia thermophila]
MRHFYLFFLLCSWAGHSQNTLQLPKDYSPPKAGLETISWMQGHWRGEAFGGITEEIWSPPLGKSMMFSFKLVADGGVGFYELGHIRELDDTLVYELKHFNADLKGWEEKDEVRRFQLVKVEGNRVYFEGFTFEKVSDDQVVIYALIGGEDGKEQEVAFNFKRF